LPYTVYGGQRYFQRAEVKHAIAYLQLMDNPNNDQAFLRVVNFPTRGIGMRSIETAPTEYFKFLLRAGRAALYPVYKGTFERRIEGAAGPNATRDRTVQFVKDAFRSVDFLESRADIQKAGVAYYGLSSGATLGTLILALEPRFKAGILIGGGMAGV